MVAIHTTTELTSHADFDYTDPATGTFIATRLTLTNSDAAFYQISGGNIYSGSAYLKEGVLSETVRVIEVESTTSVVVEQLTNVYTNEATITWHGYTGTPGIAELAKNSSSLFLYPSLNKASQGVNEDRDDLKRINDNLEVIKIYQKNFSQNCIIQGDTSNTSQIKIVGTSERPVMFAQNDNLYLEDAEKTLDLNSLSNQFYDIYVQEDTGDAPPSNAEGSKPIALTYKGSGIMPYTTSASDKYLIGCVYLFNNTIIAINNLETENAQQRHPFKWDWSYDNFFSNTSYTYNNTKIMYVPCFKNSRVYYSFHGLYQTSGSPADAVNFDVVMRLNDTTNDTESRFRIPPFSCDTNVIRGEFELTGNIDCSKGFNSFTIGGKIGTDDATPKTIINIYTLIGSFVAVPSRFTFNSEV